MPKLLKRLLLLAVVVLIVEVTLRLAFGFGKVPVYYSSAVYEYALTPRQHIKRFGNTFFINEHGMRSAPLAENELRILKFGDSVLNGGVLTDQKELATDILERRMYNAVPNANLRILNVSNGSWGPDNAYGWIETHGNFDAKLIVLVFSSHDWQDQMTFQDAAGNVPFYPDKQPLTAIGDLTTWMWSRKFQHVDWNSLPHIEGAKPVAEPFNTGWERFYRYAMYEAIPLLVYHHPSMSEVKAGTWTEDGHLLEVFLAQLGVPVVSGLSANMTVNCYRDDIHPNARGQVVMADALEPVLRHFLTFTHE